MELEASAGPVRVHLKMNILAVGVVNELDEVVEIQAIGNRIEERLGTTRSSEKGVVERRAQVDDALRVLAAFSALAKSIAAERSGPSAAGRLSETRVRAVDIGRVPLLPRRSVIGSKHYFLIWCKHEIEKARFQANVLQI